MGPGGSGTLRTLRDQVGISHLPLVSAGLVSTSGWGRRTMIPLLQRPPDVTKHPHAWTATRIRAYSAQELEVKPSSKGRTSLPPGTRSPSLGARPPGPGSNPRSHSTHTHFPRASGPSNYNHTDCPWTSNARAGTRSNSHVTHFATRACWGPLKPTVRPRPKFIDTHLEHYNPRPGVPRPNKLPPGSRPSSLPAGGCSIVTCN